MVNRMSRLKYWKERYPSLETVGLAVQYFPRYVHQVNEPHGLAVVLLTYVVKGRGRHVMGDHVFEESGGSIAVTHYDQIHDILTDAKGMEIYNIYLNLERHGLPEVGAAFRDVLPEVLPLDPAFQNRLNRRSRIVFDEPEPVTALIKRMHEELKAMEPGWEEVVRSCFKVLLVECCRQAVKSGMESLSSPAGEPIAWLEKLRRRLDAEFRGAVNVTDLAGELGVTGSHLCRAFKGYTGKTVMAYVMERRVQAAMMELRSTRDKVAAVALGAGFNDLAHFNRTFKRMLGCTPREFRG
jgi:AraC-like DNA-binding protein